MDLAGFFDILKGFFTSLYKDAKLTPHTTLSSILLWIAVWGFGTLLYVSIYPQVAAAAETAKAVEQATQQVQQLNSSLSELKAGLAIERWERQLEKMRNEIFQLQQEVEISQAQARPVPVSTRQRLNMLQIEERSLSAKVDRFYEQNAKLLDPTL